LLLKNRYSYVVIFAYVEQFRNSCIIIFKCNNIFVNRTKDEHALFGFLLAQLHLCAGRSLCLWLSFWACESLLTTVGHTWAPHMIQPTVLCEAFMACLDTKYFCCFQVIPQFLKYAMVLETLRCLGYNIHHGFENSGLPSTMVILRS
jgi:hypothetical protein